MSALITVKDACQWSDAPYIERRGPRPCRFRRRSQGKAVFARRIRGIHNKLRMTRGDLAEFSGLSAETIKDRSEAIDSTNDELRHCSINLIVPTAPMEPDGYSLTNAVST